MFKGIKGNLLIVFGRLTEWRDRPHYAQEWVSGGKTKGKNQYQKKKNNSCSNIIGRKEHSCSGERNFL